jgi:polyhydroxyalkanoate synthesis regulator phasin
MDNVKVKSDVNEVKVLTEELVAEGKLDGDQAKQILFNFAEEAIRKQFDAALTEV